MAGWQPNQEGIMIRRGRLCRRIHMQLTADCQRRTATGAIQVPGVFTVGTWIARQVGLPLPDCSPSRKTGSASAGDRPQGVGPGIAGPNTSTTCSSTMGWRWLKCYTNNGCGEVWGGAQLNAAREPIEHAAGPDPITRLDDLSWRLDRLR